MKPYTADDMEADLRDAIDAGDIDAMAALAAQLDVLDTLNDTASLHASALWYAEQGLRVFPLQPGSKIPFGRSRGCKDATTDADQISSWWAATPTANIGIATGHLVDVVDIDGLEGQTSRAKHWESHFGAIDDAGVAKVLTPRKGGMHIYVAATGDGNSAGIFPGIDYRGVGGYVVAPPSRTEVGTYRFLGQPNLTGL